METCAVRAVVRVDLAAPSPDFLGVQGTGLVLAELVCLKEDLSCHAFCPVTLIVIGLLDRISELCFLDLGRQRVLGVDCLRERTVARPQRDLGVVQDKMGDLDAFRLSTVGYKAVGGCWNLAPLHPPDDVTGLQCLVPVGSPEMTLLVSLVDIECVTLQHCNTPDQFPDEVVSVVWLVGREGPLVIDLELWFRSRWLGFLGRSS